MKNNKIISKVIASSLIFAMGAISSAPVLAYTKDETVYTKADSKGSSYQTIVSEHLKNTDNLELLNDISELLNIINVNVLDNYDKMLELLTPEERKNLINLINKQI